MRVSEMPVPVLVAVTVAPGMDAPLASFTVPEMLAVTLANSCWLTSRERMNAKTLSQCRPLGRCMLPPQQYLFWSLETRPRPAIGGRILWGIAVESTVFSGRLTAYWL